MDHNAPRAMASTHEGNDMTTTTIETLTATALMGEVIATGRAMVRLVASYCCCKVLCIKYIRGVGLYPSEPDVLEPPHDEKNTGPDFLEHFSGRDG